MPSIQFPNFSHEEQPCERSDQHPFKRKVQTNPKGLGTLLGMKKSLTFVVSIAFFTSWLSPSAIGAVKVGAKCAKAGSTSTLAGKKLTCVKSGKKLVWKNGLSISIPKPNQPLTPSAKPSEATSAAPSPKSTAESVSIPTSFSDLFEKRRGIAVATWNKINLKLNSGVQLPPVEVYRGPNTPVWVNDPSEYFTFVAQVFSGKKLPKKIVVFYWSNADRSVVAEKALSVMGPENDKKHTAETTGPFVDCYTQTSCDVGHAFIGYDGIAYLGLGIPDTLEEAKKAAGGFGGVEVVEFYHSLNLLPYHLNSLSVAAPKANTKSPYQPPFWMKQGSENLMSSSLAFKKDLQGYIKDNGRKAWVDQTIPNFGPEWINDYLSIENLGNRWSDSSFKNSKPHLIMGMYLVEILVALKGPSVMLDFFEEMSEKKSFTDTFQNILGVSWNDAKPELARVIYDRYLYNY